MLVALDRKRVDLDRADLASPERSVDLVALDEALREFEAEDERKALVVKSRCVPRLTIEQRANALDASDSIVKRHCFHARARLRVQSCPNEARGAARERMATKHRRNGPTHLSPEATLRRRESRRGLATPQFA